MEILLDAEASFVHNSHLMLCSIISLFVVIVVVMVVVSEELIIFVVVVIAVNS